MKPLALGIFLAALALPAAAHDEHGHGAGGAHAHGSPPERLGRTGGLVGRPDVVVQVNGLVCDFCARGLQKSFSRTGAVSGVAVDLAAKEIRLKFVAGAGLDDAAIRKLVRDAGYSVATIRRPTT